MCIKASSEPVNIKGVKGVADTCINMYPYTYEPTLKLSCDSDNNNNLISVTKRKHNFQVEGFS